MNILAKMLLAVVLGGLFGYFVLGPVITDNSHHSSKTETVYADPGGDIFTYMARYNEMADKHESLKIDGICASACTFFFNLLPTDQVCATDRAWFGFHGVYTGFGGFNEPFTQFTQAIVYPDWLRKLLANEYGFDGTKDVDTTKYPTGVIWITGDKVQTELHIPLCA